MEPADREALQAAVADLNDGHIDRFLALMSDEMTWTGVPRGLLWWRHTPS